MDCLERILINVIYIELADQIIILKGHYNIMFGLYNIIVTFLYRKIENFT